MSQPSEKWNDLIKSPVDWTMILSNVLKDFECVTGTIHRTDAQTGVLVLTAHQGIPPFVLDKIQTIPFGKGIAGCAAERREAVQLCNLQIDATGVAKPAAKQTNVQGALATPLINDENKVVGVLGIGKMQPYEFSDEEISRINVVGKIIQKGF
jgi:putative methionine-R-sulfoxide reductase with GAF domain